MIGMRAEKRKKVQKWFNKAGKDTWAKAVSPKPRAIAKSGIRMGTR